MHSGSGSGSVAFRVTLVAAAAALHCVEGSGGGIVFIAAVAVSRCIEDRGGGCGFGWWQRRQRCVALWAAAAATAASR